MLDFLIYSALNNQHLTEGRFTNALDLDNFCLEFVHTTNMYTHIYIYIIYMYIHIYICTYIYIVERSPIRMP